MKSTIYFCLILAKLLTNCPDAFSQSKLSLSVTMAPFYAHVKSTVEAVLPDPNSGALTSQTLKSESSPKGYWAGLNGRYSFSNKWSASTGLWYSHARLKTPISDGRSHNFAIPLFANFQVSQKRLSPYFSAGALWNFATTSRVDIRDFGTVTFKSDQDISRISPMVGAGVIYHFAQRLSLIAQPTFSYAIPPSGLDVHVYQWGLNVQLMVNL